MRYLALGVAFAAVGFVVANALISVLTVLLWRVVRSSPHRARPLFWIRMLPAVGSVAFVAGLVMPAFWLFEPRATEESASPALFALVLIALGLVANGLRRAFTSWRETRRLERLWRAAAVVSASPDGSPSTYRVQSPLAFAALVGVVRPRLFVSGPFLDALSENERNAVLEHEAGHLRSRDNLKRLAMCLAPDWLASTAVGGEIERAWAAAAEEDADDHAAGADRARSLDLAGALLKASHLTPMHCAPASNFCDEATIGRRVSRLLSDSPEPRAATPAFRSRFAYLLLALTGAASLLAAPGISAAYAMTEAVVRLLQ